MVEDITRKRQPFPQTEAIYFITPEARSIRGIIDDFETKTMYSAAHVFCTSGKRD